MRTRLGVLLASSGGCSVHYSNNMHKQHLSSLYCIFIESYLSWSSTFKDSRIIYCLYVTQGCTMKSSCSPFATQEKHDKNKTNQQCIPVVHLKKCIRSNTNRSNENNSPGRWHGRHVNIKNLTIRDSMYIFDYVWATSIIDVTWTVCPMGGARGKVRG